MKRIVELICILMATAYLVGCAASLEGLNEMARASQRNSAQSPGEPRPEAGKALVVFLSGAPSSHADQLSFLYDGDQYIGISKSGTKLAYQATPGEHLFMLASENAHFMGADLEAGKTYYVDVHLRNSLVEGTERISKGQFIQVNAETGYFDLSPNNFDPASFFGKQMQRGLAKRIASLSWWQDPNSQYWVDRQTKVRESLDLKALRKKYLPSYEKEGDGRPFLAKSSGR